MPVSRVAFSRLLASSVCLAAIAFTSVNGLAQATSSSAGEAGYLPETPARALSGAQLNPQGSATFSVSAPAGASSVWLQVTARSLGSAGDVTFCGSASCTAPGLMSVSAGRGSAELVRVPLEGGTVSVRSSVETKVWADVVGYGTAATTPGAGTFTAAPQSDGVRQVKVQSGNDSYLSLAAHAPQGAVAAVLSITTPAPTSGGYIAACPGDQAVASCARTSVVNLDAGEGRTVTTVVKLDSQRGVAFATNLSDVDLAVTPVGYLVPGGKGLAFAPANGVVKANLAVGSAVSVPLGVPKGTAAVVARLTLSGAWRDASVNNCASVCGTQPVAATFAASGLGRTTTVVLPVDASGNVRLKADGASLRASISLVGTLSTATPAVVPTTTASARPSATASAKPSATASAKPSATASAKPSATASAKPSSTASARPTATATAKPSVTASAKPPAAAGADALKVVNGDMNITKAGEVVDGVDVHGVIKVNAPNVTIKNSVVRGNGPESQALVHNYSTGLKVIDTVIAADVATANVNGIMGSNFTLERVEISHVVDQVHIYGDGNVTVKDSWLHSNLHYANDPNWHGGPSHDDNVQIESGTNITVTNSRLEGSYNAAVMVTQDRAKVSHVTISDNQIAGGGCSVNFAEKGKGPFQNAKVTGNVFTHNQRVSGCAVIRPLTSPVTISGNTWKDGSAVAPSRG